SGDSRARPLRDGGSASGPSPWPGDRSPLVGGRCRRVRRSDAGPARASPLAYGTLENAELEAPRILRHAGQEAGTAGLHLADNLTDISAHKGRWGIWHVTQRDERRLGSARVLLVVE